MNYDITFCEGENCAHKEQCHRYRELLRWRSDKNPNRGDVISLYNRRDPDRCTLYWKEPR